MKKITFLSLCPLFLSLALIALSYAQSDNPSAMFDDKQLLEGYAAQYADEPKDVLLAMINDDTLSAFRSAAAVRVFNQKFSQ
ncbi:MAG TPA: hypothetical protein PLO93_03250, partial [Candidatus Omnitrophota bacterium]|nr:hypothetical protein [Candidatus Omnitrophota bacterium]